MNFEIKDLSGDIPYELTPLLSSKKIKIEINSCTFGGVKDKAQIRQHTVWISGQTSFNECHFETHVCLFMLSIPTCKSLRQCPQFAVFDAVRWTILLGSDSFSILAGHLALPLRILTHYPAKEHNYSWPCSLVERVCQLNSP